MNNGAKGKNFGRLIRQQRAMIPLTLQELAIQSGISPSHLGRVERGERFPSASILQKIAKPLKIDVNGLFILAGYLPTQSDNISEAKLDNKDGHLDPYVSWLLSQEPPEVQRAVIGILSVIKCISQASSKN